ncbi:hypothetical protein EVAR_55671_1 [Eumeta japonica]|uniref:Uncharacterized protein n=1 Tax=Eumeta variegata TaxID=151549 RepID=A0A4C2A165_EUMVA|nr:hypothetical protein EVAR_55671_1 [Eumeta japonica]
MYSAPLTTAQQEVPGERVMITASVSARGPRPNCDISYRLNTFVRSWPTYAGSRARSSLNDICHIQSYASRRLKLSVSLDPSRAGGRPAGARPGLVRRTAIHRYLIGDLQAPC